MAAASIGTWQGTVPAYPSPVEMAMTADGSRLYVVCEGTNEVVEIDPAAGAVLRRVRVGQHPKSIALSADGRRLYVANSWSDTVSEIDAALLKVVRELPTGWEPNAAVADAGGRFLYMANRMGDNVSVVDWRAASRPGASLAGRGAAYLSLSPDGDAYLLHAHLPGARSLPHAAPNRK